MEISLKKSKIVFFIILRIVIGWHFLYEGIVKLFNPEWSAYNFLANSKGLLSSVFTWLTNSSTVMSFIDLLNIWGLIFIGVGLILGCFTQLAAIAGVFLLSLYYLVQPPDLIVNKILIELSALLIVFFVPTGQYLDLDRLLIKLHNRIKARTSKPPEIQAHKTEKERSALSFNRRELIKSISTIPILGLFGYLVSSKKQWQQIDAVTGASYRIGVDKATQMEIKELDGKLPTGNIGNIAISRLILGGNLLGARSHSRDLTYVRTLMRAYNTKNRIFYAIQY